jgi:predicted dehydrogenase
MHFAVNAGIVPPDAWFHDHSINGGRIIGEACHFIDLLLYIAQSPIVRVSAARMGKGVAVQEDKMSILLSFADGSIGTVNYFSNGAKSYPKEQLEIYSEGRILRVDNFRKTSGYGFRGFRSFKTRRLDKGHTAEINAFVTRATSGGERLIPLEQMVNVTLATFAAITSAQENRTVELAQEFGL